MLEIVSMISVNNWAWVCKAIASTEQEALKY
jgi:hypothetical protein